MTAGDDLLDVEVDRTRHVLASLEARQRLRDSGHSTYADEQRRIAANADPETCELFGVRDLDERIVATAETYRACGIDDGIFGAIIVRSLIAQGVNWYDAELLVIGAGIDWRPRTDHQRLVAVVESMLADGWPEDVVYEAVRSLESS